MSKTETEDDANMVVVHVAVSVTFTGELQGAMQTEHAAICFAPRVQPDSTVKVILPVLVNHKAIDARMRLQAYEAKAEKDDKRKHEVTPIDGLAEWKKQRVAAEAAGKTAKAKVGHHKKG